MFEFFFKYPAAVFSRGTLVLLGTWPVWSLGAAIVLAAVGLWFWVHRNSSGSGRIGALRSAAVWLLQTLLASLLLLMLWHPALSGVRRNRTSWPSSWTIRPAWRGRTKPEERPAARLPNKF